MNTQYQERMHAWNMKAEREFEERQAARRLAEHHAEKLDIERNGQTSIFDPTPAPVVHKSMRQLELYSFKEKERCRRVYGRKRMLEIQKLFRK